MWSSGIIPSGRAERGFVLATTLLVTTLLTVMLAASFLLVSAEQRTTDNSYRTARALALAQAGLQNYFSQNRGLVDTSTYDSTRIILLNGYADVVATKVRGSGAASPSSPLALWVVRSTGVGTSPVMAGQVLGSRTIAQFAQLNLGKLPARAAMVALNGVQKILGTSGTVNPFSGVNYAVSVPGCTNPASADTFAISTIAGSAGYSKDANVVNPDGKGVDQSYAAWNNLYDSTHIDWPGLVNGNFIPDYIIPAGAPATSPPWPTPMSNTYPLGYSAGDVTIPASAGMRGMLVVKGNVTMSSGAHWDGIIVAGGTLDASAGGIIHGMAITGLSKALSPPGTPGQNNIPQGAASGYHARVQWSWCYAQGAVNSMSSLVPIKNAWADTWSTY
jgi:Tfp pilus assembly protein PilX